MSSNNSENRVIAGALTYPASTSENAQPIPIQPRQPRNLQGLLRFAMEATKAEDAPGNSELGPMDEQRRKFLEDALKSLTVNMAEVLKNAIQVLTNQEMIQNIQFGVELPSDVQNAFQNILDFVDDIDTANDFYKLNGFAVFPICLGCENDTVRSLACSILGELCQNNPFCQARALESGLVNIIIHMVDSEQGLVLSKAVYALSCMIREFEPACKEFIAQDGCNILVKLLHSPSDNVRTKVAFLVRYLCQNSPRAKTQLIEHNLTGTLINILSKSRDGSSEHILSTLLVLVEDLDATVLSQCRNSEHRLKEHLEKFLKIDDILSEEKEYCMEILNKVFENYTPSDENDAER